MTSALALARLSLTDPSSSSSSSAVIACGVVGFLCAILLLTLLAYRLKKKDEGSYDLGDTKLTNTQYQKAPTQEFYA